MSTGAIAALNISSLTNSTSSGTSKPQSSQQDTGIDFGQLLQQLLQNDEDKKAKQPSLLQMLDNKPAQSSSATDPLSAAGGINISA